MNLLELQIISSLVALLGIHFIIKQKNISWPLSIVACTISFFIYKEKHLYAKCIFIIFAIINSFYGLFLWTKKKNLKVSRTKNKHLWLAFILGLILTLIIGEYFKYTMNDDMAYWEAFYSSFGIITHFMMVNKKLESWIVWIVIDIVFANVCIDKFLYILAIKYFLYSFIAVYGYFRWRLSYLSSEHAEEDID